MARPYALLRAGFPYLKTVSMRRVIDWPVDVAVTSDMRVLALCKFEGAGGIAKIARVGWDDDANLGDIGTAGTGEGQMMWPAQMLLDRDENIVVSDEALHRITFMTTEGDFIGMWGEHGSGDGQLDRPSGIAYDADENLYVVDTMNHRVQKFTKDGRFILKWGSFGDGPGQFNMPWGIDVDELGDVYVSDWRNDRVQKFTAEGDFVFETGTSGSGDGELSRPAGICVDGDGDIYVADSENDRVVLFNPEGQVRRGVHRRRDPVDIGQGVPARQRQAPQAEGHGEHRTSEAPAQPQVRAGGRPGAHVHPRLRLLPRAGLPEGRRAPLRRGSNRDAQVAHAAGDLEGRRVVRHGMAPDRLTPVAGRW